MSKRNVEKTIVRRFGIFVMLTFIMCLFCSCRDIPVLKKTYYSLDAPIDEDKHRTNNDEDNELIDYKIPAKAQDESSDVQRDMDYSVPIKGNEKNPLKADDEVFGETREERSEARTRKTSAQSEISDDSNETGSSEENEILSSSKVDLREIIDANDKHVKIPSNVEKVSAVGDAALYVEMLGGTGRLVASSDDLKNSKMAARVFGQEEIHNIAALWSGNGSTPLSDRAFKQLLEVARPEVCFVCSGAETFSDVQLEKLSEEEVYVITLPKLNNTENIKKAVNIIAQVLGDRSEEGGLDALSIAEEYSAWLDSVIKEGLSKKRLFSGPDKIDFNNDSYINYTTLKNEDAADTGDYTIFVSDWDDGASYTVSSGSNVITRGDGMAIAASGYSTTPLAYYMSIGGLCNTSALSADLFHEQYWYVSPLVPYSMSISENAGVWNKQVNKSISSVTGKDSLGAENFKYVIAANKKIKKNIEDDKEKEYGLWKSYGFQDSHGVTGYGMVIDSTFIYSNVIGDYEVLVNPCGAGRWTSGSPEAALEVYWVNGLLWGDFSHEYINEKIKDFYKEFYRYELSSDEIKMILRGEFTQ